MEYWLKNKDKSIQLPIRPASFNVTFENTHQTVNVQTRGDVTILGKKGLKAYTIESFFPAQDYPFCRLCKRQKSLGICKGNPPDGRKPLFNSLLQKQRLIKM